MNKIDPVGLLACPFCGEERLKVEMDSLVVCQGCLAEGPFFDGLPDDDWRVKVRELWNTRAPSASLIAAQEALTDIRNRILCPVGPSPSLDDIEAIAAAALSQVLLQDGGDGE